MSTPYPVKLPPGMYANGTPYEAKGRWRTGNLVRWVEGRLRPVGGWSRLTPAPMDGVPRGLHAWSGLQAQRRVGIGTNTKLYAFDQNSLFDITPVGFVPGREVSIYGLGYGANLYGREAYGTVRSGSGLVLDASTWQLDNFGDLLVACATSDGKIYQWPNPANPAIPCPNSPTGCRGVFVTDERFLVAIGAGGDPRRIAWASQETIDTWAAATGNSAGGFNLQSNGIAVSSLKLPGQTLIFTTTDVHSFRFVGAPFFYGRERVGSSCGIVGPNAKASIDSRAVWMSYNNFYIYDGSVQALPCDVWDAVFPNFNVLQGAQVYGGTNADFGEVWFFYPSANSTVCDSYVVWNYKYNYWFTGQMQRSAWVDREVWPNPLAADEGGHLWQHETGWLDNGQTRVPNVYVTSGPIELGNGEQFLDVDQAIPATTTPTSLQVSFGLQRTPDDSTFGTTAGPYPLGARGDGYVDMRFSARQATMTVQATADTDWTFGPIRLMAETGSER